MGHREKDIYQKSVNVCHEFTEGFRFVTAYTHTHTSWNALTSYSWYMEKIERCLPKFNNSPNNVCDITDDELRCWKKI